MIAGRYTLDGEIGRGGAGIVHLARDEVLGRTVAIKRIGLLPGTTDKDIERAQREARIAAGITHPHVVSILDLVKDVDCYWLVMEHVRGRTLSQLVAADGPLDPPRAAGILAQAADGLAQAHQAGIVHRDVKPSNILVSDDDHAKLGDFGIARGASDPALTVTGEVTGSPAYLAPEVASGSPASPASDVWSLGATLHHAVVGRAPYDVGANVMGGLYRIVHDEPPRLPADHPMAELLTRTMVKDPAERWSAERVRDELRRVARGRLPVGPATPDATSTTRMETVSAAAAPVAAPAPLRPSSSPAVTPARDADPQSGRGPWGWIAALAALVVIAGVAAWLLGSGDDERPDAGSGGQQSQSPEPSDDPSDPSSSEPTDDPTSEPTEEPTSESTSTPASGGTRAEVRTFLQDYFSLVTSDPEAAYDLLTPGFQEASGGYERYSGFWSTISSARAYDIAVDPDTLVATYTIDYETTSGRSTTQQGRLQLERAGDGYLIADEG